MFDPAQPVDGRPSSRTATATLVSPGDDPQSGALAPTGEPEPGGVPEILRVSIVIPVFNEQATIAQLLYRVSEVKLPKEIIIVDDGSSDGTWEVVQRFAERSNFRAVRHERNLGKGAALRTGFREVTGDIVVTQDADLEYDPADIPRLIQPISAGEADVVYGSRFLVQGPCRVQRYWHALGNKLLTHLSNALTNLCLTDMETGYKAFRRGILDRIAATLKQNRFGIEPELTAKVARCRARVYEVPVRYAGRSFAEGKKIGFKDAVQAVWCMGRYAWWD